MVSIRKCIALFSFFAAAAASAQMDFSLKTNSDFPTLGTDFGYRMGRFEPFVGVSNYSFHVKYKDTYTPDPNGESSSNSTTASVFITSLGFRYSLRDEGIKPYLFANLYKLITEVDISGNSKQQDDEIESLYSPFGAGAGFGADYEVAKGFVVFGEYGFRALFPSSSHTNDDGLGDVHTSDVSMMLSALSGAAGIRFYF